MIDLRSDTVTRPTDEMKRAMMEADLGDDVYGEDPTVNRLEELAASMLGKEAALLVTSGTQGNQIAVLTHTRLGDEVILEADSHIFYYEAGAVAAFAGVQTRTVPSQRGAIRADVLEHAIRGENIHFPKTGLICVENTHNRAGGAVVTPNQMADVYRVAQKHQIPVHLDGARLFNAAVALGQPVQAFADQTDTIQFCLSKGLSAPIGSIIAGNKEWIDEARRWRKKLGGGMRQAGIIAAPGVIALTQMVDRLADDHANAKTLAHGLANISGLKVDLESVETNIVLVDVEGTGRTAVEFLVELKKAGVLAVDFDRYVVRFTTHREVSGVDMNETIDRVNQLLKG